MSRRCWDLKSGVWDSGVCGLGFPACPWCHVALVVFMAPGMKGAFAGTLGTRLGAPAGES